MSRNRKANRTAAGGYFRSSMLPVWKTVFGALVLGVAVWLLLPVLLPVKPPPDFPEPPDLQSLSPVLAGMISAADAEARKHPGSAETVGRLGMVYHANQFGGQAESAYEIASRLDPDNYRWSYYRALLREENGQERAQCELLGQTVRLRPDYMPALQKLGDIFFKQNKIEEAVRYYERCIRAVSEEKAPQAVFALGRMAIRSRDWRKAIRYLGPLSRQYPLIRPAHQLLADAYEALGQAEMAAGERRILLQADLTPVPPVKDPLSEELIPLCCSSTRLLKEAGLRSRFGHPDQALPIARRAMEVAPQDADARNFVSRTLLDAHGSDPEAVDEALTQLDESLRLRPDDHLQLLYTAAFFFKQSKTDAAVERLRSMLARHDDNAAVHYYLGVIAEHLGRPKEAEARYREVLKRDPNHAEACDSLGLLLVKQGKLDQAVTYFEKAVRLNPAFVRARSNLGVALSQQGKTARAAEQFREALRLKPNDAPTRMFLAILLMNSGKFEEAAGHFREKLRMAPGDPDAHYGLACALAAEGKVEEAMHEFKETLRLRPDFAEAAGRLQQLERRSP